MDSTKLMNLAIAGGIIFAACKFGTLIIQPRATF